MVPGQLGLLGLEQVDALADGEAAVQIRAVSPVQGHLGTQAVPELVHIVADQGQLGLIGRARPAQVERMSGLMTGFGGQGPADGRGAGQTLFALVNGDEDHA